MRLFCDNCGAQDHHRNDCLEPPRKFRLNQAVGGSLGVHNKIQAAITGPGFKSAGDVAPSSFEAKRDTWEKFDTGTNFQVSEWRQAYERPEDPTDHMTHAEVEDPGSRDEVTRSVIRNFRQRADVAGYLLDLSAEDDYNPKSRRLQTKFEKAVGVADVSQALEPTKMDLAIRREKMKKEQEQIERGRILREKYGEADSVTTIEPASLSLVNPIGPIKDAQKFPGSHISVWGSWFDLDTQRWGFSCCKQTVRQSPCTRNFS